MIQGALNSVPTDQKSDFFSAEELALLRPSPRPRHVAVMPDGNRRWAKRHTCSTEAGHNKGADVVLDVVRAAQELGIRVITVYTFSTENWTRPQQEIDALFMMLDGYLKNQRQPMIDHGIQLHAIGNLTGLPSFIQKTLEETKEATSQGNGIRFVLALNYGGRDDICRAAKKMIQDVTHGLLQPEQVNEETFSGYLDTAPFGDPDLLIRTSGELRVSNFLLWQISYTELYTTQVYWPDFTPRHLLDALVNFQQRDRRIGT